MSEVIAERYRLVGALGEGGMGRVWQARDELLGRDVALKELVLPRGLSTAEIAELRERAIREARAAARIDHPNVVRIFDVLQAEGNPWIVMEFVPSRSLHEVVREHGAMAPERAAGIGLEVLAGLCAAHRAGVLHRDVKPANVLLGEGGRVVLTDFGLAATAGDSAITGTGIVLGSPSYLAPERALDDEITAAADLWSLGATLYAAVEGRPPYDKSSPVATLAALATQPPRPPEQAGVLRATLDGLLRKDPAERIDADEAERLLRDAARGRPLADVAESPKKSRKKPALWWSAAVTALLLAGGIAARPLLSTADADEMAAPPASASHLPIPPDRPSAALPPADGALPPLGSSPVAPTAKPTPTTAPTKGAPERTTAAAPLAAVARSIDNVATADCLQRDAGTGRIVLRSCDGSDAQKFDFRSDGTMRVLGLCVELLGTDNGARLGTAGCSGATSQQWNYNASYDLVSLKVDKCADVPDSNPDDGTPAQIWDCSGNGNQKWHH